MMDPYSFVSFRVRFFCRLKKLQAVHADVWRLVEENAHILSGVEQLINLKKCSLP